MIFGLQAGIRRHALDDACLVAMREADHQLVRDLQAISSEFRGRRTVIENEKLLIAECEPCHLGHAEPRMCAQ